MWLQAPAPCVVQSINVSDVIILANAANQFRHLHCVLSFVHVSTCVIWDGTQQEYLRNMLPTVWQNAINELACSQTCCYDGSAGRYPVDVLKTQLLTLQVF